MRRVSLNKLPFPGNWIIQPSGGLYSVTNLTVIFDPLKRLVGMLWRACGNEFLYYWGIIPGIEGVHRPRTHLKFQTEPAGTPTKMIFEVTKGHSRSLFFFNTHPGIVPQG